MESENILDNTTNQGLNQVKSINPEQNHSEYFSNQNHDESNQLSNSE